MFKIFISLLIIIVAVGFGLYIQPEPTQVVLIFGGYRVDTNMWLATAIIIATLFVVYILARFISLLLHSKRIIVEMNRKRKTSKALISRENGLLALLDNKWLTAERLFSSAAGNNANPAIDYFGAAYAAHESGNIEMRDTYFHQAEALCPDNHVSLFVFKAQLYWLNASQGFAIECLQKALKLSPGHPAANKLLANYYLAQNDWINLLPKLDICERLKVMPKNTIQKKRAEAYDNIFKTTLAEQDYSGFLRYYNQMPKSYRSDSCCYKYYLDYLLASGEYKTAVKQIKKWLYNEWSPTILDKLPACLTKSNADELIRYAESLLSLHPLDLNLFICLARLNRNYKHWQNSIKYYEKALETKQINYLYVEVGYVYLQINQIEQAMRSLQKALRN